MPEESLIGLEPAAPKKKRKKAVRRKKAEKSIFKLDSDSGALPVMPKASVKIGSPARAKKGEPKHLYRKMALTFVTLTVALVAVVLYFTVAKVTIIITPAREKISSNAAFEIANKADAGQIAGVVKQVPVEETKTFTSSGREVLGEEVVGKVTIYNNYVKNQPLVATTRLLSPDGKLFRLANTVNVPAGGQVEADVYADQAKPEMAIGPTKFILPGLWAGIQDKIFAQSQEPMKYSEKARYTIQQSDIDNAVKELKNDLADYAKSRVSEAYKDYDQALFQFDNQVSQEVSGKVGEEKKNFTISTKTKVTVVAFNTGDIYNQAKAKLASELADDKEIAEFEKSDISYGLSSVDLNRGVASVIADFSGKAILKDGARAIKKNNLAGMSYEQLKSYLNNMPEVAGFEINFMPAFIKNVPKLADRIEIVIKK